MQNQFIRLRNVRGSIFMLPIAERLWGTCSVCSRKTMLAAEDRSNGWLLGSCCIDDLVFAQKALASVRSYRTKAHTQ